MLYTGITVNGEPLQQFVAFQDRIEVSTHLQNEITMLGKGCGLRRSASAPSKRLLRPGPPKKAINPTLRDELAIFLPDESYPLADIARFFNISMSELRRYQRLLDMQRRRRKKS